MTLKERLVMLVSMEELKGDSQNPILLKTLKEALNEIKTQ